MRAADTRVRVPVLLLSGILALAVLGCSPGGDRPRFLSVATGGTGGVYYPYGGAIAKVLNDHLAGVRATAEVTAASVDNLKLLADGRADLAFTLADTLADAVAGRESFDGRPVPAASLAVLYSNYTHLVTLAPAGIRTVADLRGRTVSTGSPGSGTEVIALRLLRAAGLDPDVDVRRHALGVSESVGALKDGKVAAFFWSGGLPTSAVQDLAHTPGMAVRLIPTADLLPVLQRDYGDLYAPLEVPAVAYRGLDGPVAVVGVDNVLVVSRAMSDDLAYDITRLIFEHQGDLEAVHPEAAKLSLETAAGASPAEFHAGAIRFYRERGAWRE